VEEYRRREPEPGTRSDLGAFVRRQSLTRASLTGGLGRMMQPEYGIIFKGRSQTRAFSGPEPILGTATASPGHYLLEIQIDLGAAVGAAAFGVVLAGFGDVGAARLAGTLGHGGDLLGIDPGLDEELPDGMGAAE
jgi:hypothetical protein